MSEDHPFDIIECQRAEIARLENMLIEAAEESEFNRRDAERLKHERDDAYAQIAAYHKDEKWLTMQRCMKAENRADSAMAALEELRTENRLIGETMDRLADENERLSGLLAEAHAFLRTLPDKPPHTGRAKATLLSMLKGATP